MTESQLDYYWQLASDVKEKRDKAMKNLIASLTESGTDADWDYALERLIRGLSSSRKSSRHGFSETLVLLLHSRSKKIKMSHYLDLVDKHLKNFGKVAGHEERGFYLGELFALEAIGKSFMWTSPTTTMADLERFIDELVALASKKSWLRESCFYALFQLMFEPRTFRLFCTPKTFLVTIIKKIADKGFAFSLEGIALYIKVPNKHKRAIGKAVPNGWPLGDPFAKDNLALLNKVLKKSPIESESDDTKAVNPAPSSGKLHFAWQQIVYDLFPISYDDEPEPASEQNILSERFEFKDFWTQVIDENFFSSTTERKSSGFDIFRLFFKDVASMRPDVLEDLLSPSFLRCLINQSAVNNRLLHKKATALLSDMVTEAEESRDIVYPMIRELVDFSYKFDRLSKTSTVQKLITLVPKSDLWKTMNIFADMMTQYRVDSSDDGRLGQAGDGHRLWAMDSLLALVKTYRNSTDIAVLEQLTRIICFMTQESFFDGALPSEMRPHCLSRLNSMLSALLSNKRPGEPSWPTICLLHIQYLEEDKQYTTANGFEEGDELTKKKDKALKTLHKIRKRLGSNHVNDPELEAFELLFSLVILQVYSADVEASDMLDELHLCYNKIIGRSQIEEGGQESEHVDPSTVLTEILISFLSRKSSLLRQLAEEVWSTFTGKVTFEGLNLLFDILGAKESKQGQDELFNDISEGEESEDIENMEMNVEDEEEEQQEQDDMDGQDDMDLDDEMKDDESSESDSDMNNDSSEDEEDENNDDNTYKTLVHEADEKAGMALSTALGINGNDESNDFNSDDDDDDEGMDDEQMMALDATLSSIFRERQRALTDARKGKKRKLDARDARENVVHLKSRALDLLAKYIQNEPSSWNIINCILPLLSLIKNTKTLQLGEKAHTLLKTKLCRASTLPVPKKKSQLKQLIATLADIHLEQAKFSTNTAHALACSQCSVFLVKTAMAVDSTKAPDLLADVYKKSLADWIKSPNSKVSPSIFFDMVNYFATIKRAKK